MSRRSQRSRVPFQQDADAPPLQEQEAILRSIETHHRKNLNHLARSSLRNSLQTHERTNQQQQALPDSAAAARRYYPQKRIGTFIDLTQDDDNPVVDLTEDDDAYPPTKKLLRSDNLPLIDLTQKKSIERDVECSFQGSYGNVRITGVHNSGGGHCQYESIAQAMSFRANSSAPPRFQGGARCRWKYDRSGYGRRDRHELRSYQHSGNRTEKL